MKKKIMIFIGDWGASGVVSWAYKMRKVYADDPLYEIRIVCLSRRTPIQVKCDDHLSDLTQLGDLFQLEEESFAIPNAMWEVVPELHELMRKGYPIFPVGFCRAYSEIEYFEPLALLESFFPVIVSVSPECTDRLCSGSGKNVRRKVFTRPTGIHLPKENAFELPIEKLQLVYAGRFHRQQKRIEDFIPLIQKLDEYQLNYQFHFYGSGSDQGMLESGLKNEIGKGKVLIHGRLSPDEIERAYLGKHLFVQLSEYEGTSNSMLEAMGFGLVPMVTDTGSGVRGVIKDKKNGFLFNIASPDEVAGGIVELSKDRKNLLKASKRAYRTAKKYDMKIYKKEFSNMLSFYLKKRAKLLEPYFEYSEEVSSVVKPIVLR